MLRRMCTMAALALLLAAPALAVPKQWTWDDVLGLRTVRDPRVSPDGARIAYVVTELSSDSSCWQSDLWLGTIATGEQRRLTTSEANEESPRWAPDGRSIAFLSDRSGPTGTPAGMQVWSLFLEGGDAVMRSAAATGVLRFEWFADGKSLAYLAPEGATAAARARAARKDDSWVASEHPGSTRLWALDLASGKSTAITPADAFVSSFAISPDGRKAVYATQEGLGPDDVYSSDLWVVPVAGGKPAPLVQRSGMDARPSYSPDGRWVSFISNDGHAGGPASSLSLCIVPAAGGSVVNTTPATDDRPGGPNVMSDPMWMPDNESLLFACRNRTSVHVFRSFTDDRPVEPVTRDEGVNDWPSMDAHGKVLAWTHEDSVHPGEVWVWEFERSAPRAFTDLNPWTRERLSFPAQVITWPGADGQQVEGLLYAPLRERPGTRPPLLVVVQDEPVQGEPAPGHAQYFTPASEGYGIPIFLQSGWAVLMANPRGSAGYGSDWRLGGAGDWGGKPYEDIMKGVDMMVQLGLADSTRLAVCSWSHGGAMASNIVGRATRFRAAVAGGALDPQVDLDHSPLLRTLAVRTPTAFILGERDSRVLLTQSLEMVHALRTLGVPTDLMTFSREERGPETPRHRRAMMEWSYDWLARWTLGVPPAGTRRTTGGLR